MAGIIAIFQELGFAVSFMAMSMALTEPYTSALRAQGVEVLSGLADYADEIARLAPSLRFAWLSRPDEATTTTAIIAKLAPQAKIIYDTIDLHYVREARRSEIEGRTEIMAIAEEYRRKELAMMRAADATIVVTPAERTLLATDAPGVDVRVVSNIHSPLSSGPGFTERSGLLFVGNFNHLPNRDAVIWFAEEILPLVRAALPEVTVSVVGSNMAPEIEELARPGLDIVGWVHDLGPIYDETRVVVAPLRFGAGIKGKLGEAAMHGVPFVCTEIASEGTYLDDRHNCLIGNDAATFAAAIVELYNNPVLWQRLADEGRAAISKQCAPEVATQAIIELLRDLGID
jgi:glycosyltransferase involved in cell wall biosynthesis